MDLSTILGLIVGFALLALAIFGQGSLLAFYDAASIMIVFGGTFGAAMVQHSREEIMGLFQVIRVAFVETRHSPQAIIRILVGMAEKARREGLLSLEAEVLEVDNAFLQKGIQLVVDGTDPELVRNVLEIENAFLQERHYAGQQILESMGNYAPAFGMIGTLIGLIQMLTGLDSPESVGPGMATALLTTFYGVVAANLMFLPMAGKLRMRSDKGGTNAPDHRRGCSVDSGWGESPFGRGEAKSLLGSQAARRSRIGFSDGKRGDYQCVTWVRSAPLVAVAPHG